MMPRKVTQSEGFILQMLYALIDKKLNCIVSCRYTFQQDSTADLWIIKMKHFSNNILIFKKSSNEMIANDC